MRGCVKSSPATVTFTGCFSLKMTRRLNMTLCTGKQSLFLVIYVYAAAGCEFGTLLKSLEVNSVNSVNAEPFRDQMKNSDVHSLTAELVSGHLRMHGSRRRLWHAALRARRLLPLAARMAVPRPDPGLRNCGVRSSALLLWGIQGAGFVRLCARLAAASDRQQGDGPRARLRRRRRQQ